MQNEEFDILIRSELIFIILDDYIHNRPNNILSDKKLIEINLQNFKWLIENNPEDEITISEVLYKNYERIKDGKVIINPKAMKLYRAYLNEHNDYYIQYVIRPYYYPEEAFREYTFDPFLLEIFGTYEEFMQFIDNNTTGNRRKYIKEKFKEFEDNDHTPIVIEDFKRDYLIK